MSDDAVRNVGGTTLWIVDYRVRGEGDVAYVKLGIDNRWKCFACSTNKCSHIDAVLLHEREEDKKDDDDGA